MSLIRSSFSIGGMTLVSRVFGFIRDMLVAKVLGAGLEADAFVVAFKLPNFFRRLFAEGAFNQAFLPMFAGMIKTGSKEDALRFASDALSWLIVVVSCVVAASMVAMPWVMLILAPGFDKDPVLYDLSINLTRITFPYLLFITIVSLLGGVLNSFERFTAVASTPIIMNLSMILGIYIFPPVTPSMAHALAWGVFFAGVTQLFWLTFYCKKAGILPSIHLPRLTPEVKKLLILVAPAALGAGVTQINLMIDTMIATLIPNAVSYLYYADRIFELPLGVIGIAVATALLPTLSKQIRAGEKDRATATTNQSIKLVMLLGLPCCGALLVIAEPIIKVIFERGAFSISDTAAVFPALMAFSLGLPGHLIAKILASNFFAAQDTKTPVKIAVFCVLLNLILNLTLMRFLEHVGIALATTISGYVNAVLLGYILHKRGQFVPDRALKRFVLQCLIATFAMMGMLWGASESLEFWFTGDFIRQIVALGLLIGIGSLSYGTVILLSGGIRIRDVKAFLAKK
ncbi:MAG: murein biosynthesis integral membrane protein MurJ [Rickettsiales bacterium]